MLSKPGVMVLDFGGPQNPDELVPFLTLLLEDVLPFPAWVKRLVAPRMAKARRAVVQPNYEMIGWSPLVRTHREQVAALVQALDRPDLPVASCMMFTPPFAEQGLQELLDQGVDHIVAVPMFPHFSFATTNAAFGFLFAELERRGLGQMPVRWIPAYYDHPLYVRALADSIRAGVEATPGEGPAHLLFTPHGLPVEFVRRGDPYPEQIRESARRAIDELGWTGDWSLGWQSKLGRAAWLTPSTQDEMRRLAAAGVDRLTLVPLAFVSEHIETLHEIDIEYAEEAHALGIANFGRAPALQVQPDFIACLADLVHDGLARFERYQCVRCLLPKPEAHRRQQRCPNCAFAFPPWLRRGAHSAPRG